MNTKIQTDRKQLQDGLNEKCESEKSAIIKDSVEDSELQKQQMKKEHEETLDKELDELEKTLKVQNSDKLEAKIRELNQKCQM
jgi:hypothetical protein